MQIDFLLFRFGGVICLSGVCVGWHAIVLPQHHVVGGDDRVTMSWGAFTADSQLVA